MEEQKYNSSNKFTNINNSQDQYNEQQDQSQEPDITISQQGLNNNNDSQEDDDSDFSNVDIRDLVQRSEVLRNVTYDELIDERKEKKQKVTEQNKQLQEQSERKWLREHGKKHLIDFDDNERLELKKYFKSLDEDGSGGIGLEELEGPLISLGIAESREEVKKIIDAVDDDGNIEFKEFLIIIKGKEKRKKGQGAVNTQKNAAIVKFFKNMIQGRLGEGQISKSLPFELIVSTIRRKKLMAAIMNNKGDQDQVEGMRVLKAWEKLQAQTNQTNLNKSK